MLDPTTNPDIYPKPPEIHTVDPLREQLELLEAVGSGLEAGVTRDMRGVTSKSMRSFKYVFDDSHEMLSLPFNRRVSLRATENGGFSYEPNYGCDYRLLRATVYVELLDDAVGRNDFSLMLHTLTTQADPAMAEELLAEVDLESTAEPLPATAEAVIFGDDRKHLVKQAIGLYIIGQIKAETPELIPIKQKMPLLGARKLNQQASVLRDVVNNRYQKTVIEPLTEATRKQPIEVQLVNQVRQEAVYDEDPSTDD